MPDTAAAKAILDAMPSFIEASVQLAGGDTTPIRPGHHIPFHWPPHPISRDFHVLGSDWTGRESFTAYGEEFPVEIARTPYGVFGRAVGIWNESRGESVEEVCRELRIGAEPFFQRQLAVNRTLLREGRFLGHVSDLSPAELVQMLYCPNRDLAHEALTAIEAHASLNVFGPALIFILRDERHRHRRIAQWCVLDLFEDLPSFCKTDAEQLEAVSAIEALMQDATDDYARTIFKAGVVLGGHICTPASAAALLRLITAPSRIGRRSAMHAVFHLVEWMPDQKPLVIDALQKAAQNDPEPLLRTFCSRLILDIEKGDPDHVTEPIFPGEA